MKDCSRKTTQEERIKIVNYCLEHNKNYKKTAKLFDISYTQVYQWVKKYLTSGKEGLIINATINMYKNDHIKMYKINST